MGTSVRRQNWPETFSQRRDAVRRIFSTGRLRVRSQNARLNGVDGGVVPITIQAHYFALRAVADDVGVGDAVGLAFRYKAGDIRRHGTAEQRLYDDDVAFALDHLNYLDSEVGHCSQQAAPDLFKATPARHLTFLAVSTIPSFPPATPNT